MKRDMCVSVVMITYKHEQFIKEAIEGVLMQKADFEIELVIANDNSPDGTESIVKNIIEEHPNGHWIKYTRHPENKGMMLNFIWALKEGRGKYIALCEGDDYWTDPLKLQKQANFMENNPDYIVCGHNAIKIENGKEVGIEIPLKHQKDLTSAQLREGNFISTRTVLFRSYVLKYLPWEYKHVTNADTFLFRFLGLYGNYKYMGNQIKAAVYRQHAGGVWSKSTIKVQFYHRMTTFFFLGLFFRRIGEIEISNRDFKRAILAGFVPFSYSFSDIIASIKIILRNKIKLFKKS